MSRARHVLDRPVYSALATRHAAFAEGSELARRYDPTIIPFAAARDESAECLAALAVLADSSENLALIQVDPIVLPPGLIATIRAEGVQMVLKRPPPPIHDDRITRLTDADAEEMLQLATLTRPGPFTLKAQRLGEFFGVKENGRLLAMAGERMKQPGYTEISGVCSHPDARGRGLARLLSVFVMHRILKRSETPYLHAFASNKVARKLYESIGFEIRTMMDVALIRRAGVPPLPEEEGVAEGDG